MNMSDSLRRQIETGAAVIGLISGVAGLLGAWFIIPYRVTAVETRMEVLSTNAARDHDILVRIEERVKQMQEESRKGR